MCMCQEQLSGNRDYYACLRIQYTSKLLGALSMRSELQAMCTCSCGTKHFAVTAMQTVLLVSQLSSRPLDDL